MTLKVKFISRLTIADFQLQNSDAVEFIREGEDYDWLVVYDDLPRKAGERFPTNIIDATCGRSRTALITYEPSSVKQYGSDYAAQFGMLLTSHDERALPHPQRRDMPPVGIWYYGGEAEAAAHPTPPQKSGGVSVFHSAKQQRHTIHAKRCDFLNAMMRGVEDCAAFGRDVGRPVAHKAEGIDDFRYHIAVENHFGAHHWTEKLSDCYLGYALPFYVGCPNAADYFPATSFITLDIDDVEGSLATIRAAVAGGEYEKRLPAIIEARRRVVEEYNLGAMLTKHILARENELSDTQSTPTKIYSRRAMITRSPLHLTRYLWRKWRMRRK